MCVICKNSCFYNRLYFKRYSPLSISQLRSDKSRVFKATIQLCDQKRACPELKHIIGTLPTQNLWLILFSSRHALHRAANEPDDDVNRIRVASFETARARVCVFFPPGGRLSHPKSFD